MIRFVVVSFASFKMIHFVQVCFQYHSRTVRCSLNPKLDCCWLSLIFAGTNSNSNTTCKSHDYKERQNRWIDTRELTAGQLMLVWLRQSCLKSWVPNLNRILFHFKDSSNQTLNRFFLYLTCTLPKSALFCQPSQNPWTVGLKGTCSIIAGKDRGWGYEIHVSVGYNQD